MTTTGRAWVGLPTGEGVITPGIRVSSKTGNGYVGSTVGTLKAMPSVIATRRAPMMMTVEAMADRKPSETSFRFFIKRQVLAHSSD